MQDRQLLETKIHSIIAKSKKLDASTIRNDLSLADLGIESLDVLVIISDIEDAFDIDVPDDMGQSIETVGDIVAAVKNVTDG